MRILFVSDLHIGDGSKADDFGDNDREFAKWVISMSPDKVYLLGDVFELQQFSMKAIKKAHTLYVYAPTKLTGNHDWKATGKSTMVIEGRKRIFLSHGHQKDKLMHNAFLRGFVWFLGWIERLPFMSWVDNPKSKRAEYKTEEYAREKIEQGYDIVICGHTHKLKKKRIGKGLYVNTGCCIHGKFQGALYDTETEKMELVRS